MPKKRKREKRVQKAKRMNKAGTVPVTAAGGIVYRFEAGKLEVLLIYRRGAWDMPKGKLEKGESIAMCAFREVSEEIGVEQPLFVISNPFTTYHEYNEDGKTMGKTTYWYPMILDRGYRLKPEEEEDIEEVKWVPLAEAKERVAFQNLKDLLEDFSAWAEKSLT